MSKHRVVLAAWLAAFGGSGCDALVGGTCADGFREDAGVCVPLLSGDADGTAGGGSGGEDGHFGAPGGTGGGGGGTSTPLCNEPMQLCPVVGCVDLDSDFSNCGACGVHCPTELCVAGACVGEPIGHTVAIGASYEQSTPSARRILGNAVFRTLHRPLRIAELRAMASLSSSSKVAEVIAMEASLRARSDTITPLAAGQLGQQLRVDAFDVLLIDDQAASSDAALAQLGQQIADTLDDYRGDGGTVVVLATHRGKANACSLLAAAAVLDCTSLAPSEQLVDNVLPTDTVGNGVVGPFLPKPATAVFALGEASGFVTVFSSGGAPVVLHQAWTP